MNRGITYHCFWLWLCAALLLPGPSAQAQQPAEADQQPSEADQQPSEAEQQAQQKFQEGMAQMRAHSFEQACQLFEQSQALAKEMTTQFRLGECYEALGRTASAWRVFEEVAKLAEIAMLRARHRLAAEKAGAIETKLMKVRFLVADAAKAIPGLTVTLDGQPYPQSSWGLSLPIDPGVHRFVASAPGYEPWQKEVRVWQEGTIKKITLPGLEPARPKPSTRPAPAQPSAPGQPGSAPAQSGEPPDETTPDGEGSLLGPMGLIIGGAGVAVLVAGIGVGLAAKSKYDDAVADSCSEELSTCTQAGHDEQESARLMGDVATALFVVGGAAAAAGLVLWLVAPSGSADEPATTAYHATLGVSLQPGALSLGGTF